MYPQNHYKFNKLSFTFHLFLFLNLLFFSTHGEHVNEYSPFCNDYPYNHCYIEARVLEPLCGRYITNGGVGVSQECCDFLTSSEPWDAGIVHCLCHGSNERKHFTAKPLTAKRILKDCLVMVDGPVDMICRKNC